ncbi:replication-associated protein [robinz virus RP_493]|uniref:Replication-associated protein n=1 Tax=robinz virus RP_493 TaxID=2886398 RepID=A0A8K1UF61_9CIRC|nr:replication-associated protein [robinz virus RP_493]UDN67408.1 replication-associated protein [robinz virus RP_493]
MLDEEARVGVSTLNNYDASDCKRFESLDDVQYIVFGREKGSGSGTEHLQGYVRFKTRREFSQVRDTLGTRCHVEQARSGDEDNRNYCTKDGDYYERGTMVKRGGRSDLVRAADAVLSGSPLSEIANTMPNIFVRYSRGLRDLQATAGSLGKRTWCTELWIFFGESGSGKSFSARLLAGESVFYKQRGKWWCGYSQEKTVVIDDFYGWLEYDELLRIADEYPHRVEIKGGYTEFLATRIIVTSNKSWTAWYTGDWFGKEQRYALGRRITRLYYCIREPGTFRSIKVALF